MEELLSIKLVRSASFMMIVIIVIMIKKCGINYDSMKGLHALIST